ncbi:hypothetical protein [Pseudaestuariivita rosea]|uniref:hypothetical protein n=1 Tax=Pseudaestuariivita rosea TaxID=2763263 RepID=UPI001ABAD7C3|nr:hypothetical protein [Pseudaestuariivita rosea]
MERAGLAILVPSVLVPVLGPVVCISLVGIALFKLLKDDNIDTETENGDHSAGQNVLVDARTSCSSDNENIDDDSPRCQTTETVAELPKQEMIRQVMSELGKRSGAARAKKAKT